MLAAPPSFLPHIRLNYAQCRCPQSRRNWIFTFYVSFPSSQCGTHPTAGTWHSGNQYHIRSIRNLPSYIFRQVSCRCLGLGHQCGMRCSESEAVYAWTTSAFILLTCLFLKRPAQRVTDASKTIWSALYSSCIVTTSTSNCLDLRPSLIDLVALRHGFSSDWCGRAFWSAAMDRLTFDGSLPPRQDIIRFSFRVYLQNSRKCLRFWFLQSLQCIQYLRIPGAEVTSTAMHEWSHRTLLPRAGHNYFFSTNAFLGFRAVGILPNERAWAVKNHSMLRPDSKFNTEISWNAGSRYLYCPHSTSMVLCISPGQGSSLHKLNIESRSFVARQRWVRRIIM